MKHEVFILLFILISTAISYLESESLRYNNIYTYAFAYFTREQDNINILSIKQKIVFQQNHELWFVIMRMRAMMMTIWNVKE